MIPEISAVDYNYMLPPERIAQFPLDTRDGSRLLVWEKGKISESSFSDIPSRFGNNDLLVFNDSKVIPARLIFSTKTGATVEIFCLEPISPDYSAEQAIRATGNSTWKCLIGNVKRWKSGPLVKHSAREPAEILLTAQKGAVLGDGCFSVSFSWDPPALPFSAVLEASGLIPLPPYIHRAPDPADKLRYQTIYATHEGSVAAPTAGLHFTPRILKELGRKNIRMGTVTLHVGLGTFRPVSASSISGHTMHGETFEIGLDLLEQLAESLDRRILAVGTTSVRALESLYWIGVKRIIRNVNAPVTVDQWDPYRKEYNCGIPASESLGALVHHLKEQGSDKLTGVTCLLIVPGYTFRLVRGMITNFHLPQSTLLMLVAAFTGDEWRGIYHYALRHDFRFLSYGDACLLLGD